MTIDNIRGRSAAILLATVLAAGGTSLLFGDVIFNGVDFTQKHFQTICIVLGTTIASIVAAFAWENRHWLACLGFIGLAASGTAVIAWYSLGRQTETQIMSADDHDKAAEQRMRLRAQLEAEEKARTAKRLDADAVCKKLGPDHKRCLGARAVEAVYTDSVAGIEARLAALKVKPADASAEAFGNLVAALGGDREKAKALALLLMPYFITGLFELGLAMSLHYAFRPSQRTVERQPDRPALTAPTMLAPVSDAELVELRSQFAGEQLGYRPRGGRTVRKKPDGPPKTGGLGKRQALQHVLTELALGRTIPSQEALKEMSGRPKQTISDWMRDWERSGLIPARTQRGRCKSLTAAD